MFVTLGVEEELQVVDALTGALTSFDVDRAKAFLAEVPGGIASEIHACTLELQTPVAANPNDLVASLARLRDFAATHTALHGKRVLAAGLHPFSSWQDQVVHATPALYPHYAHLLREYGEIARSAMSFGLHVHLGISDPKLRMPVMNGLRNVLPELLALSANSPFHEGRDTGLSSWRHSVLGRYPRMGIPDSWPDETAYFAHIERLRRVGSLEPTQAMWDDLRLHHRYGTLEIRICDTVPSLERIWLIAALLQCEAMTLIEETFESRLAPALPTTLIDENKWRARRHGLDAMMVDWARDELVPTPVRFERWLARLLPAAVSLGLWPRIELGVAAALAEGSFAEQQRTWLGESGSFESVVMTLIAATAEPWSPTPSVRPHHVDVRTPTDFGAQRRIRPAPSPNA